MDTSVHRFDDEPYGVEITLKRDDGSFYTYYLWFEEPEKRNERIDRLIQVVGTERFSYRPVYRSNEQEIIVQK